MNVLVIGAHPDDEILGPGGTLVKHKMNGDDIYSCILCEHVTARKNKPEHEEFLKQVHEAANIIGIKDTMFFDFPNIKMNVIPTLDLVQSIEKSIVKFKPEVVYTHHVGDLNDDHKIVFNATMAAIRLPERRNITDLPTNLIKEVLCYEVPSSTEWSAPLPEFVFMPNVFVNIKETFKLKLKAIQQYAEIVKEYPHPRSIENLDALAKYRGAQSGFELAEAFMLVRGLR